MNNCPIIHKAPDGKEFNSLKACEAYCNEFPWVYAVYSTSKFGGIFESIFTDKTMAEHYAKIKNEAITGIYFPDLYRISVHRLDITEPVPTVQSQIAPEPKKESWLSKIHAKYCKG